MVSGTKRLLKELRNPSEYIPFNTAFGESISSQRSTEILEDFVYNINTKTLTTTTANGGTVTHGNTMAVLSSSTASNGQARLETKKSLRYRPGHEGYLFLTLLFENGGVAGATQYAGLFDTNDGYFLGFNGTDFTIGRRYNGTDTTTTVLNGDPEFTAKWDPTKLNIFHINYAWLGTAPINFYWMNGAGKWILIHTLELPNTLTIPSTSQPTLTPCIDITKTSGSEDIVVKTASMHAGIAHDGDTQGDRYFTGSITKDTVSTESVLINFKNVSTFQGKTNRVRAYGEFIGAASDGTKKAQVKVYKNLTITSPSWTNVDSTNSIMQTDTVGTVTPSDANLLFDIALSRTDSASLDIRGFEFFIDPGETATVTAQSGANSDFIFTARWRETF